MPLALKRVALALEQRFLYLAFKTIYWIAAPILNPAHTSALAA